MCIRDRAKCWFYTVFSKVGEAKCWFYTVFSKVGEAKCWFSICFLKKMNDLKPSGRPGPERPNFSKTAGCKKPYKILCKRAPQTRFRASGSPGTVFEVPGGRSQRRRKAILTRLSAKTAPDLAKRTKLSAKTAIGIAKPTIPYESVSKSSHGETAGEPKTYDSDQTVMKKTKNDRKRATHFGTTVSAKSSLFDIK